MTCKIQSLRLVVAAALALSAVGASAASAAEFHSASAPSTITGAQSTGHVFTTDAGTVTCKTVTFSGTQSAKTTTEVTLTPKYESCKAFGFAVGIPIHVNGCGFRLNASGTTELECPTGKAIEITVPGCTTSIGPQHFATGMEYTTIGTTPSRTITAHSNISGISYNECGTPTKNGTYKGSTKITGSAGEVWFA